MKKFRDKQHYIGPITMELIEQALSWGYHTAKDEQKGFPSKGYGTRFKKEFKIILIKK